ncbi:LuxR C-terminal-related transcriptional regulator [Rhodococcus sp. SJ-2]
MSSLLGRPRPVPRAVTRALSAEPPLLLLVGGAGTGKSEILAALRDTDIAGPTRIVDDAHTLTADVVEDLALLARSGTHALVVATEPRAHRVDLRALASAFSARSALVELRPWTPREIAGRASALGQDRSPESIQAVHRLTGGVPDLAEAALSALLSGADPRQAVAARVRERVAADRALASVLALADLGIALDATELAAVLAAGPEQARDTIDAAHASGLLLGDALLPGAAGVPAALLGAHAVRALARALLAVRAREGTLTIDLAVRLAATGITEPGLSEYLVAQSDSADSTVAAMLLDTAVETGADADTLATRRAEAAIAAGDLATAERLTDRILEDAASRPVVDVRTAVRIAATAAAQQGMLGRSADLYEWLGPGRAGPDAPIGAAVLLAAGRPDAAALLRSAEPGAPTSSAAAAQLFEAGLRESVGGDGRIAMNRLTRALATRGAQPGRMQPDSIEAVTALLCLHAGELSHARTVLAHHSSVRHRLLTAWASLLGGDMAAAAAEVAAVSPEVVRARDRLFLHGLRVGLARRTGDLGSLLTEWAAAQEVVAGYSVDLFGLLPLGELWLAGVRAGDSDRIAHLVTQAHDLLAALGEPPLWGAALHWYGVQAAITADHPADLVPHARALATAAESSSYAAALARAGHAWLTVLKGDVDATRIRDAAQALATIGLPWDGARLASEGALRASDTSTATALLQLARTVRQTSGATPSPPDSAPDAASERDTSSDRPACGPLSDRETEVADLVVSGLTYREVGNRLYISAKTVEHHVARIRRRLGAGSRSELLSMLRAMGYGVDVRRRDTTYQNGGTSACP